MSDDFSAWVGRTEEVPDSLDPARSSALLAALGDATRLDCGAPLPLLHHWLYFWDVRPPEGLGIDGHPARGGFLPPVALPRRMWAGGRLRFVRPLILGERVTRTSTILKVEAKSGRSGDLVFVTVEHVLAGGQGPAVIEQQDIVYKGAASPGSVAAPGSDVEPAGAAWRQDVFPDAVLLFRYSGLTMNGHRIHYDRPYAMDEEAYPALVVQGPLQATLLAGLAARRLDAPITAFDFRGQQPAFDGTMLHVCGAPTGSGATLWTEQGGTKNMIATVTC
ncbi:FAS1-like dehydratase domain-containing protein [Sphingomonas solaris]|uniref:Acyl-CoA dehydrogenase n=1 Tax=Alterirhizorhabdus solaris TaxID=2529389 RepID=A0A558RD22_9SPHN|nr:MaoC family dehydratase N-terminal domain-containing protein [Sphingomonas solaris]TVV77268.1 acyl-CoA dehydrogenase [Sphingomonas solaris]